MNLHFSALEARVLGSLIEKEITTPDQYPLSLNALVAACNQKSNRDPVLALAEAEVQQAVDGLARKHVVLERGGFDRREQVEASAVGAPTGCRRDRTHVRRLRGVGRAERAATSGESSARRNHPDE